MISLSHPLIGPEEQAAVARVLGSGQLASGPEVAAFEAEFAAFVGVPHAVAVSNGTTALWLSLWAGGIGPGDEVIVPSFTFAATAGSVLQVGARPVYADIDPATYCINADTVRPHIGPRTRPSSPSTSTGIRHPWTSCRHSAAGTACYSSRTRRKATGLDGRALMSGGSEPWGRSRSTRPRT